MGAKVMDAEQAARLDAAELAQQKADDAAKGEQSARLDKTEAVNNRGPAATASGYGQAVLGGINSGIAHVAGIPVDLSNLVDLAATHGTGWLADKVGLTNAGDTMRSLYHPTYTGSSQSFLDGEKKLGIGYDAQTPGEQATKDFTSGATTAALAAPLGPAGKLDALVPRMTAQGIAGASGVAGGKAAQSLNEATGNQVNPTVADIIGSIFGGVGAAGVTNRFASNPSAIADDFKTAKVNPAFPSDVGNNTGKQGIANRLGAQTYSKESAQQTQNGIGTYADNVLEGFGDGTDAARVAAVNNQATQGASIANKVNKTLKIMDSRGDSIIRNNAARNPDGTPAYPQADPRAIPYLQGIYDDTKKVVEANPDSATIPSWLSEQSKLGPNRLADVQHAVGPEMAGQIGKEQLRNAATVNGPFNLVDLMDYWKSVPGATKEALVIDPAVREGMQRTERLYDATKNSRDFMNQGKKTPLPDVLSVLGGAAGTVGGGIAAHLFPDLGGAGLVGSAVSAGATALPAISKVAAMAGQRNGLAARAFGPSLDNPLAKGAGVLGGIEATFPDVYTPPASQPTPTPGQVQSFLGNATPEVAQSYVSQKLGPQVASQIPSDPQGAKAAIFSLFADPNHRQALTATTDEAG